MEDSGPASGWNGPPVPLSKRREKSLRGTLAQRNIVMSIGKLLAAAALVLGLSVSAADAHPRHWRHRHHHHHHHNNPPGPVGGPGTNWHNPPGPVGGPGASPHWRGWHYRHWHGRYWYWNPHRLCWYLPDRDDNPPGPAGGPGTNWENPPGPVGGPGASPDRNRCR
jgi:hypothetical protein